MKTQILLSMPCLLACSVHLPLSVKHLAGTSAEGSTAPPQLPLGLPVLLRCRGSTPVAFRFCAAALALRSRCASTLSSSSTAAAVCFCSCCMVWQQPPLTTIRGRIGSATPTTNGSRSYNGRAESSIGVGARAAAVVERDDGCSLFLQ